MHRASGPLVRGRGTTPWASVTTAPDEQLGLSAGQDFLPDPVKSHNAVCSLLATLGRWQVVGCIRMLIVFSGESSFRRSYGSTRAHPPGVYLMERAPLPFL